MKTSKKIVAFILVAAFAFLNSSCTLLTGSDVVKVDKSYPDDIVPLYKDSVVCDYENDEDEVFELFLGTKDSIGETADYYSDYFYDNDIVLSTERRGPSGYTAAGAAGNWTFEVNVKKPESNSDKRQYNALIEIYIEARFKGMNSSIPFDAVDISSNQAAKDILKAMQADLQIIEEIVGDAGSDEDMSLDEMLEMLDSFKQQLDSKINEIKGRTLTEIQLVQLQNSEIALFEALKQMFDELQQMCYYAVDLMEISINMDSSMAGIDGSNEYLMYAAVENALTGAVEDLKAMNPPTFLQYKHDKMTEKLDEYLVVATDSIWAYSIDDSLRMSNYNYFTDYYMLYFTDFVIDIDNDLTTRVSKFDEDIDYMKAWKSELEYFINNTLNSNVLDLTLYNQEYLSIAEDVNVSCVYTVPDEIVPANYRSMDYLVFLEIWTNKDSADVMVTVEIPEYTQQYKEKITVNRAETELAILPPLVMDINDKLNISKDSQIEITIENLDTGEIIMQETEPILLNSIYDMYWESEDGRLYYENILSWVTPENDMILQLQRNAADSIEMLTNGMIDGIWGYQGDGGYFSQAEITYYQTAAIMHAMADTMSVKYINASFSTTDRMIQRIATPERVLENASGLCIETSVTLASALEAARMNVMILILPSHAQVAVETWYNSGEYLLVETTALQSAKNQDFEYVIRYLTKEEWQQYINDNSVIAIDCSMAPKLGIYPIE